MWVYRFRTNDSHSVFHAVEFYKQKQKRRGGNDGEYAQAIKISMAEGGFSCFFVSSDRLAPQLALNRTWHMHVSFRSMLRHCTWVTIYSTVWNTHARIERRLALAHIQEWTALTPPLAGPLATAGVAQGSTTETIATAPGNPNHLSDLDTADEHALRALLLGISHRTAGNYEIARVCLGEVCAMKTRWGEIGVSTWIPGVAMFEMAVLELKAVEASFLSLSCDGDGEEKLVVRVDGRAVEDGGRWEKVLNEAEKKLDGAAALAGAGVSLSSRLGTRIEMLRDEIMMKRGMLDRGS